MIKKEYQLVPVSRSLKEFRAGVLVQNKQTRQFGTIRIESLRRKNARRNLRHSFTAVRLCVIDAQEDFSSLLLQQDDVLFTLKDGSYTIGDPANMMEDSYVKAQGIILDGKDVLQAWVMLPSATTPVKFYQLTPKIVQDILNNGGKLWMQMEDVPSSKENILFTLPKLVDNCPIIHLKP